MPLLHSVAVLLVGLCSASAGRAEQASLFSFLPEAGGGRVEHRADYAPSGSEWAEGLDERKVFHHQLSWGPPESGWRIRFGKGGQIYSFVGPFGEAMPPQIHHGAEWNDEVWQLVSVCSAKNDRVRIERGGRKVAPLAYFIHGSGVYRRDPQLKETFYNPILAECATGSSYAMLNWGQHAHVPTIHKSSALYYTRVTALQDGSMELCYAIHNFGGDVLNYFNTPWGGVRESVLPVHVLSTPGGGHEVTAFQPFNDKGLTNADQTGGWCGFFQEDDPEAWGIVLVFGNSPEIQESAQVRYRWGYAGAKRNPRDYFVSVVNPRLPVGKGQTLMVRIYAFVTRLKDAEKRATVLNKRVSYKVERFAKSPTRTVAVDASNYRGSLELSCWPREAQVPLFLVKETESGKTHVTTDPYRFGTKEDFRRFYPDYKGKAPVLRPYDGRTEYLGLLGFTGEAERFD